MRLISCLLIPLLLGAAASAQDAASQAREAIAALAADESAAPSGRITLSITERRGRFVEGEKLSDTRKRLGGEKAVLADGSVLYSPDGWIKDFNSPASEGRPATRTRTGETAGTVRMLVEATLGGETQRRGWVLRVNTPTPADAILGHRVGKSAEGITWNSARRQKDLLTLEGTRGAEKHTVVLRMDGKPQIRSWALTRSLESPSGAVFEQQYTCEVDASDSGIRKVEEWVVNPPPAGNVAYRLTEIKKSQALSGIKPEELQVRFPKGTTVTDARAGAPVEYELTEEDIPEEKIAAAVRAIAADRVAVGQPVPDVELTDLAGKPYPLSAQKGKVLVLFWFSSRSRAASAAAKTVEAFNQEYRSRGVQFLGLDVAEDGDAAKQADAFGKQSGWRFPILLDPGAGFRRFGAETALPKVAVIDREGKLAYAGAGFDTDQVSAVIDRLAPKGK
ncbi:MAG TPA: redoxin family protein [Armatimonadota bacterium]|nr:redoxin family protein [Armatimonadota bacterium]